MGIFEFEKFCYCFTLKTGCIVSGILFLLLGMLRTLVEIDMAADMMLRHILHKRTGGIFANDIEPSLAIVFSVFLLYGAFKEKSLYVFAGAIYIIVVISRNAIATVLWIISTLIHHDDPDMRGMIIFTLVAEFFLMSLIYLYLLVNIYNFYKELNKRETGQTFQRMRSRTSIFFEDESLS